MTPFDRYVFPAGLLASAAALTFAASTALCPQAHAADATIALSVGFVNENPPVTVVGGSGVNADPEQARIASLNDCVAKGGSHCVTQVIATNACGAIGSNDFGEFTGVQNVNLDAARGAAVAQLSNQQGARVVISGCSTPIFKPPAEGMPEGTLVEQPPDAPPSPVPTPVPCQPQPWCQQFPNLPTFPVLVPNG